MIHVDTQIHGLPGIANKRTLQLIRCLARSAGAGFYPSTVSCFIPSRERVHIRLRLENDGNLLFFRWDMFPRSQEGMCVCFFRWHHLSSYPGDLQDFRFQMDPNGIPLKKQIIESSNQTASGNRCKANIRSLLSAFTSGIHPREKIYSIEIFLLLSSKKT